MECEPVPLNASSFADNVSTSAPSFAVNLSRKVRQMRSTGRFQTRAATGNGKQHPVHSAESGFCAQRRNLGTDCGKQAKWGRVFWGTDGVARNRRSGPSREWWHRGVWHDEHAAYESFAMSKDVFLKVLQTPWPGCRYRAPDRDSINPAKFGIHELFHTLQGFLIICFVFNGANCLNPVRTPQPRST